MVTYVFDATIPRIVLNSPKDGAVVNAETASIEGETQPRSKILVRNATSGLTVTGAAAFTHGTITEGTNPLDNSSLAGTPFDNITPSKVIANARFTSARGRWWVEYGVRGQAEVTRVAETLLDSPFLIAQDLLSLQGFAVQRLGWGVNLARGRDRVGLTFAVENLADEYYREQFQFAPARGRSVTIGLNVGAF